MNKRKYTDEQLSNAKDLYMKYTPWQSIQDTTGVEVNNIRAYSAEWKKERDLLKSELIENVLESKRSLLMSIAKYGLEIVERGLKDLLASDKPLTARELANIANIIDNFDKIVKLDDGQATERTEVIIPASIIELKKLMNDPFLMIDEAEIVKPKELE